MKIARTSAGRTLALACLAAIRQVRSNAQASALVLGALGALALSMPQPVTAQAPAAPLPGGTLPVPCAATGTCGANAFVTNGAATWAVNGATGIVTQTTARAILNWQSFNIAPGATVTFRQPDATSSALNRIFQGTPSVIQGALNANGQVLLINQNGIVFGNGAQVNTASFLASSLNITDRDYLAGLLAAIKENDPTSGQLGRPVFVPFRDANNQPLPSGPITIEPTAILSAANGGRVAVFAPTIDNQGTIRTPDGQTILGAGNKVWLEGSANPNLRGLLVEVDTEGNADSAVRNIGQIVAERGNATLIGMAVRQDGRVSATTAVGAEGSIRLLARKGAERPSDITAITSQTRVASTGGTLTLGENSVTEVLPDAGDSRSANRAALLDANGQPLAPSRVELMGREIVLERNAAVVAPAGDVTAIALADPRRYSELTGSFLSSDADRHGSRIELAEGSRIDTSGRVAEVPMSRNAVSVSLRGNELRDVPLQRDGVLRGETVVVDARVGTSVADVKGAIENVPLDLRDAVAAGGNVALRSQGDVILRPGSTIDVSGGGLRFAPGVIATTRLVGADGKIYDIGSAPANLAYSGFADRFTQSIRLTDGRVVQREWLNANGTGATRPTEPGYFEGRPAGAIEIVGYGLALGGTLRGAATAGEYQRFVPGTTGALAHTLLPGGGSLAIGRADLATAPDGPDLRTPAVVLRPGDAAAVAGAPGDATVELSTDRIAAGGFGNVGIYSNANVAVRGDATLAVPAGGQVRIVGQSIDVQGRIEAPAGTIALDTRRVAGDAVDATHPLVLGPSSVVSTRGTWTNDLPTVASTPNAPVAVNGGSIALRAAPNPSKPDAVTGDFAAGSVVDASGGAWMNARGSITRGNGGRIEIAMQDRSAAAGNAPLGATVRAEGAGRGGSVAITAREIVLDDDGSRDRVGQVALGDAFFDAGGFQSYTLRGNDVRVAPGASVEPVVRTLQIDPVAARSTPSGADVRGIATLAPALPTQRAGASVGLEVTPAFAIDPATVGSVTVGAGSTVRTDPGGSVTMRAPTRIAIDGTIEAPAGTIAATLVAPSSPLPPDYDPTRSIVLGPDGRLLARGAVVAAPDTRGLPVGSVLAGGSVTLDAERNGHVVTRAGSVIDVSGTAGELRLGGTGASPTPVTVPSSGGTARITALDGLVVDGALRGAPGGATVAGGTLVLGLAEQSGTAQTNDLAVRASAAPAAPAGFTAATPVAPGDRNRGSVSASTLAAGGFDDVTLRASRSVTLDAGTAVNARRGVTLDTPNVGVAGSGTASVSGAYVAVGPTDADLQGTAAVSGGTGTFRAQGDFVDLVGNVATQGVDRLEIASTGDVRARGIAATGASDPRGSLTTRGDIAIAGTQVYPSTLSNYTITATPRPAGGPASSIAFSSTGTPGDALTAGGSITARAPVIRQDGTLLAPFGAIDLGATDSLVLGAGSVTSVSGAGRLVPFGTTQNGLDWVVDVNGRLRDLRAEGLPDKSVRLAGRDVDVRPGARVDLAGGGELSAAEFTPGPGGSLDALRNADGNVARTVYAIVPGMNAAVAPFDQQFYAGSNLKPGDSVWLAGGPGVPAGVYPLLPARYALLPGALLVTPVSGYRDLAAGQSVRTADGATVVAGYRTSVGGAQADARTSGFRIEDGVAVRRLAEYRESVASTFFPADARARDVAVPALPNDAGRLVVETGQSLALDGTFATSGTNGGRGARVDLSAERLAVVTGGDAVAGFVNVDAGRIAALGAESLAIGASRTESASGTALAVNARDVVVASGASVAAREVIVAGRESVSVRAGARIEGNGTPPAASGPITVTGTGAAADGALVRAAGGPAVDVLRDAPARTTGRLDVASGATVAGTALTLDATRDTRSSGTLDPRGGSVALSASRISVGELDPATITEGIALGNADVAAQIGNAREVTLRSYSSIDLHGAARLGGSATTIDTLALDAGAIRGVANGGAVASASAREIVLRNSSGAAPGTAATGTGTLALDATERLVLGAGNQSISGFARTDATAGGQVTARGAGTLNVSGDLAITGGVVTAERGAERAVTATGDVRISQGASAAAPSGDLGGRLAVTGRSVDVAGRIAIPAGNVALSATTGDVSVRSGATIDVHGERRPFLDTAAYADGGAVSLASSAGNVTVAPGATIDVAADARGGDAGRVTLAAPAGRVALDGTVRANAGADGRGGRLAVDANRVDDFAALAATADTAGFTDAQSIRLRTGDAVLPSTGRIVARDVEVTVDAGRASIAGQVNASGASAGRVAIQASGDVAVSGTITARATGEGRDGGRVMLGTSAGTVAVAPGARIDTGAADGVAGTVVLRAPRTGAGAGTDVAVSTLAGDVVAGQTIVEGVQRYDVTAPIDAAQTALTAPWGADATAFMSNAPAMLARLGAATRPELRVEPGIELRGAGNLVLSTDWSLHTWRWDRLTGAPVTDVATLRAGTNANGVLAAGALTMRAAGDARFDGSLSDGFAGALASSAINDGGPAWRYRIAAGADLASADVLATRPLAALGATGGSVVVAPGAAAATTPLGNPPTTIRAIRTGRGDIDIAAGRDVDLQSQQSMIYTAGAAEGRRRTGSVSLNGATVQVGDTAVYPSGGGDLAIEAGGDVRVSRAGSGATLDRSRQLITGWLHREAAVNVPSSWWLDYRFFQQGVGALGGGDVTVRADGSITNLGAAAPTTRPRLANDTLGGGDLVVEAGKDIRGGVFLVGDGTGRIAAGDNLAAVDVPRTAVTSTPIATNPVIAIGDAKVAIKAGRDLAVESVLNPTMVLRAPEQPAPPAPSPNNLSFFYTYDPQSSVSMSSLGGNVALTNSSAALQNLLTLGTTRQPAITLSMIRQSDLALKVYPPTVRAAALQGDVRVAGEMSLFPAPTGQLEFLAGGSVTAPAGTSVHLSDAGVDRLPGVTNPAFGQSVASALPSSAAVLSANLNPHAAQPVHAGDPEPARVYALAGDVRGGSYTINKPARIAAGRDIADVRLIGQNVGADDVTSVVAGRDIRYNTPRTADGAFLTNDQTLEIGGPGRLEVRAGRNVDLGSSLGIVTTGNLKNPALPAQGAGVDLYAGVPSGPAADAFVAGYFGRAAYNDPLSVEMRTLAVSKLISTQTLPTVSDGAGGTRPVDAAEIKAFLGAKASEISDAGAPAAFRALATESARVLTALRGEPARFVSDVFFNELRLAGTTGKFDRGYAAIDVLFPDKAARGDLSLFFSQVRTLSGGDITLFVPRGAVNAGLASAPAGLTKTADKLGIVAQETGRVRAIVDGDFLVNQSRVFTLRGGDLLLWSSAGDIDAGRGARSVVSAPPPAISVDDQGNVTVRLPAAAAGSGIRIQLTRPGDRAGSVDLIAPTGTVDAGDAGIESAGDINIAALAVVNAQFIASSGGSVSGVPAADTSGLAAGLSVGNTAAADATRQAEAATRAATDDTQSAQAAAAAFKPSFLSVEVLCIGEDCR